MLSVPDLGHDHVALRAWQESDAPDVYRACQDAELQRWVPVPVPYTREHARGFVTTYAPGRWASGSGAPFAVVDVDDGRLLGAVELHLEQREAGIGELGYWSVAGERCRGAMSAAVWLLVGWGFESLQLSRLQLLAATDNEASNRVAAKCGFAREGVLRSFHVQRNVRQDVVMWSRLRDDPPRAVGRTELTDGVVRLRPPTNGDVPALAAIFSDPDVVRYTLVPHPATREAVIEWVSRVRTSVDTGSGAVFVITTPPDDEPLGTVGVHLSRDYPGRGILGYLLGPRQRRGGVMQRALTLVVPYARDVHGVHRFEALTHLDNVASQRLLERCGFEREGVLRSAIRQRGQFHDAVLYARVS